MSEVTNHVEEVAKHKSALLRGFLKQGTAANPADVQNPVAGGQVKMEMGAPHKCEEVHAGLDHSQWALAEPKQDMPAYVGGAAPGEAQGTKSAELPANGWKVVEKAGMEVLVPTGSETLATGPATFCDFCHSAIGRWTEVKGMKACRKCVSRIPELRQRFMK